MNIEQQAHGAAAEKSAPIPLMRWIWGAYFKTSLIPLLIVEIGLVLIYIVSNTFSTRTNIETVRQLAEHELVQLAAREARSINHQLRGVTQAADYVRQESVRVLTHPDAGVLDDPARYAYSPDGAYYTTRDTGGSALFYSGYVQVGAPERKKAWQTQGLDAAFKGVTDTFPLVVQTYLNTHDSLNRIYPYFDVISQYPVKMDIPSFNFYYEADAAHNPERKAVWTDVYADPAGQGWMTSCIAPVYRGDFLEGVIGLDVTVGAIVKEVLDLQIPWGGYGLLVGREGTFIAMPPAHEGDWQLGKLEEPGQEGAIRQDTFKPDEYNLYRRGRHPELEAQIRQQATGLSHVALGQGSMVAWATVAETGWKLMVVVPEANIFEPVNAMAGRLANIAWLMVGGMLVFYVVFFTLLYRRVRSMSRFLAHSLVQIDEMVGRIAGGAFRQPPPALPVLELQHTAQHISGMGEQLEVARAQREQAQEDVARRKRELQQVFDLSPDGFVAMDGTGRVVLANPAFLAMTGTHEADWLGLARAEFWRKLLRMGKFPLGDTPPGEPFQLELSSPRPLLLQCEARAMYGADGTEQGGVAYIRDMTREVELNRMKGEFLSLAAHELRTPMSSIMGFAELLHHGRIPEAMHEEAVDVVYKQSKLMIRIIGDLVDLGRIDARAGRDFSIEQGDLAGLIPAAVDLVSVPEGREPVVIGETVAARVALDRGRFMQALANVLDNAYKYSTGGEVKLEMRLDGNRVGITVSDQGIGMDAAQQEQAFDRFWRADKSGEKPGTGLGLCLSREIVTVLGGTIELESEPGQGTRVTLWLPLQM